MWFFNDREFDVADRGEAIAFVYLITNKISGRKYIGKKLFYSHKYISVKKKRKKVKIESDWRDYWSSSEELKKDIELLGKDSFKREIIHLALNKGTVSYLEIKEQILNKVLENPEKWYNGIINVRIHRKHLKFI